ncbi:roadblock/LC7 domain-containing protein [Amycolatopsis sp. NPDC051758]|uniref:roadblock/LC7 domain-containing protein n=1 Tax=Amycolatopsis sp. NPDC051758 TaxID=3363935 RepID=UPI003790F979
MTPAKDPWMLEQLSQLPGVRYCLVITSDGLVETHTDEIDRDRADPVAAACSALLAGASAVEEVAGFEGSFQQNFSQWSDGFLFVRRAGDHTCLAVATDADINAGLIAHAMAERIKQIGESTLSTPARA